MDVLVVLTFHHTICSRHDDVVVIVSSDILLFRFDNRRVFYTIFYFENFKEILQLMQSLSMS